MRVSKTIFWHPLLVYKTVRLLKVHLEDSININLAIMNLYKNWRIVYGMESKLDLG